MSERERHADDDFYPMPLFPELLVTDLDTAVDWYRAVGFEPVFSTPGMAHLRYARYADLMLQAGEETAGPFGRGVSIRVNASEPVEAIVRAARERGADVEGPTETPYNTRRV